MNFIFKPKLGNMEFWVSQAAFLGLFQHLPHLLFIQKIPSNFFNLIMIQSTVNSGQLKMFLHDRFDWEMQ